MPPTLGPVLPGSTVWFVPRSLLPLLLRCVCITLAGIPALDPSCPRLTRWLENLLRRGAFLDTYVVLTCKAIDSSILLATFISIKGYLRIRRLCDDYINGAVALVLAFISGNFDEPGDLGHVLNVWIFGSRSISLVVVLLCPPPRFGGIASRHIKSEEERRCSIST